MREHNFSTDERNQIIQFLLEESKDGKPAYGRMKAAVELFNSSTRQISRLWAQARLQREEGRVMNLKSGKLNPKRVKTKHPDYHKIRGLPMRRRNTIRMLAKALGVSRGIVFRWIKLGLLKAHTSALKPFLTEGNKLKRLRFCLDSIMYDKDSNVMKFRSMQNIIHIDEKWFYITTKNHRMYLTPGEVEPHRTCKSKAFIPKIMFMCAMARPIVARDGTVLFDGKIGIFPFTKQVQAKRDSINRKKGTWITKPIDSITKDVVRDCILQKIIPAIKEKWPKHLSKTIFIQQDNARPHILNSDPDFRVAASADGFNIHLMQQPPNSPDLNVNDLGFFNSIQSIQNEYACNNADELVVVVTKSFDELTAATLNNVFLSLQGTTVEIMKVRGQNCYKTPHMKKGVMIRQGILPKNLEVSLDLVTECIQHLIQEGDVEGIELMMHRLGFFPD